MAREGRALFIAPAMPAPAGNGLAMRQAIFHEALSRVAQVDTLVLPLWSDDPDAPPLEHLGVVRSIRVRGRGDTLFELIRRIVDPQLRLQRFREYGRGSRHAALSSPVIADIRRMFASEDYDLVHVARLYLAEARDAVATVTATLDLDEDDAWAWRLKAAAEAGDAAAWSNAEADAEDRLLARLGGRFATCFAAGPQDQASLSARHPFLPIETIPNAVDFPEAPVHRDDGRTLLFVGALGYAPNRDGILWFVRHVWPLLRQGGPWPLRFQIAGRSAGAEITGLENIEGIEVLGPVTDLDPVYAQATLAIAPLHTGAGTRIKVIEAAAHGVPMIATAIATRGLDFARADTMWLADAPEAFAAAIRAAIGDPAERRWRADVAYAAARHTHDRVEAVNRLASRFAAVLASAQLQRGFR
jgi:glycosyltransferase involved in cell wall biosynthesis